MTSMSTRSQLPFVRRSALEIAHFSLNLRFRLRRMPRERSAKRRTGRGQGRDEVRLSVRRRTCVRIFRGRAIISIQFSRSSDGRPAAALWTWRVLLPWRLIAFRRDNISALISLCGGASARRRTLEINLSAPVYLRSLDSSTLYIISLSLLPRRGGTFTTLNEARPNRRFPLRALTILPP